MTVGSLVDITKTPQQENIVLDLLQWITDARDPSMKQDSERRHIMKMRGWRLQELARGLRFHQENIEPGLQEKDLREITDRPTKEIPIPEIGLQGGEKERIIEQITLQSDMKETPDLLPDTADRHQLEDQGLHYPGGEIAGLLHHPVRQAEEAETITSHEAMDQPQELWGDTTLNSQCLRLRSQSRPKEKSGSVLIRES